MIGLAESTYRKVLVPWAQYVQAVPGTDILTSDFTPTRANTVCRIDIVTYAVGVQLALSPSSGVGFFLNAGVAIPADSRKAFEIPLDPDRSWNLLALAACALIVQITEVEPEL